MHHLKTIKAKEMKVVMRLRNLLLTAYKWNLIKSRSNCSDMTKMRVALVHTSHAVSTGIYRAHTLFNTKS